MQASWQSPCALVCSSYRATGSARKSDSALTHVSKWPWVSGLEQYVRHATAEKLSDATSREHGDTDGGPQH